MTGAERSTIRLRRNRVAAKLIPIAVNSLALARPFIVPAVRYDRSGVKGNG